MGRDNHCQKNLEDRAVLLLVNKHSLPDTANNFDEVDQHHRNQLDTKDMNLPDLFGSG